MVTSKGFSMFILLFFLHLSLNAQTKDAQMVLNGESRRFEAMIKADTIALSPLLAEELVYVHSNGLVENKAAHLEAIASRKLVYKRMDRQEAGVRFYGRTALVNGLIKVQGILNGNSFEVSLIYLAVYRKKKDGWVLINWQSTKKV